MIVSVIDLRILEKLDDSDQEKVAYFLRLLLKQSKYRKLEKEIYRRREEIKEGNSLTHDEIWKEMNV